MRDIGILTVDACRGGGRDVSHSMVPMRAESCAAVVKRLRSQLDRTVEVVRREAQAAIWSVRQGLTEATDGQVQWRLNEDRREVNCVRCVRR